VDHHPSLEKRVELLESSLRRTRRLALGLTVLLTVFISAAFVMDDDEVRTRKLVLMESEYLQGVTLVAGPHSSLVIQAPTGTEIMRLGGDAARPVGDSTN
jgi:hypothetical protein